MRALPMTPSDQSRQSHPPRRSGLGRLLWMLLLGTILGLVAAVSMLFLLPMLRPAPPPPLNGAVLTPPRPIPALTLQRTDGSPFSTTELNGQVSLVFFGYTFCPDVCPMTLSELLQMRRILGADADRVAVYFVTVDPGRDTADRLRRYVKAFDPAFEGLTGDEDALAQMRAAFGAIGVRREAPDGGPNYFMDHTAAMFLVDRSGSISMAYAYGTPPQLLADDMRRLTR